MREKTLGGSGFAEFLLLVSIRWLVKLPDPLAVQLHEPKTNVVPALIVGKSKLKDAIKLSADDCWRMAPWWAPVVGVLPAGSPRYTLRRVVEGRDSPRLECDGGRNIEI